MSTPGSLTIVSKRTNQSIPATGPVDDGTLILFTDKAQGIADLDRLALPLGDTTFHLQLQVVCSTTVAQRPTWIQVELARLRATVVDTTGKARRHIVQPGTTTFPDIFSVEEYVNDMDGEFGWTITHNGTAPITVQVAVYKAKNELASLIHRSGGYNRWSDGTIR